MNDREFCSAKERSLLVGWGNRKAKGVTTRTVEQVDIALRDASRR